MTICFYCDPKGARISITMSSPGFSDLGFLVMKDSLDPPLSSKIGPLRRENPCTVWIDPVDDITDFSAYAVAFDESGQAADFYIEALQGGTKLTTAKGNLPPGNPCDCGAVSNGGGLHMPFSIDTI